MSLSTMPNLETLNFSLVVFLFPLTMNVFSLQGSNVSASEFCSIYSKDQIDFLQIDLLDSLCTEWPFIHRFPARRG